MIIDLDSTRSREDELNGFMGFSKLLVERESFINSDDGSSLDGESFVFGRIQNHEGIVSGVEEENRLGSDDGFWRDRRDSEFSVLRLILKQSDLFLSCDFLFGSRLSIRCSQISSVSLDDVDARKQLLKLCDGVGKIDPLQSGISLDEF